MSLRHPQDAADRRWMTQEGDAYRHKYNYELVLYVSKLQMTDAHLQTCVKTLKTNGTGLSSICCLSGIEAKETQIHLQTKNGVSVAA
jgi:hypothetical protein